jgi:hypothetical protein
MEIPLSKEMWVSWKQDPVTNLVMQEIRRRKEFAKEGIATGKVDGNELQRVIGACMALQDIVDMEYRDSGPEQTND